MWTPLCELSIIRRPGTRMVVYNLQPRREVRQAEMIVVDIKEHFDGSYTAITPCNISLSSVYTIATVFTKSFAGVVQMAESRRRSSDTQEFLFAPHILNLLERAAFRFRNHLPNVK